MKTILAILCLSFAVVAPILPGCSTPPSSRVVQVQTLKAVGESAEAAVKLSAQLYQSGTITSVQARAAIDFYNQKFQPAFRLAVATVNANLNSTAAPEIADLATQLSALVSSYLRTP